MDELEQERRLWRLLADGEEPAGRCPDSAELASYLDGRLAWAEVELVEDHLSRCARCCGLVIDHRSESGRPSPRVPGALLERARHVGSGGSADARGAEAKRAPRRWLIAAAALAALMAGWSGWQLGARTATYEVRERRAVGEAITFGLAAGLAAPPPPVQPAEEEP